VRISSLVSIARAIQLGSLTEASDGRQQFRVIVLHVVDGLARCARLPLFFLVVAQPGVQKVRAARGMCLVKPIRTAAMATALLLTLMDPAARWA